MLTSSLAHQPLFFCELIIAQLRRKETFARYLWTLSECWQSQTDCSATNYDVCITLFVVVIGCAALRLSTRSERDKDEMSVVGEVVIRMGYAELRIQAGGGYLAHSTQDVLL